MKNNIMFGKNSSQVHSRAKTGSTNINSRTYLDSFKNSEEITRAFQFRPLFFRERRFQKIFASKFSKKNTL